MRSAKLKVSLLDILDEWRSDGDIDDWIFLMMEMKMRTRRLYIIDEERRDEGVSRSIYKSGKIY